MMQVKSVQERRWRVLWVTPELVMDLLFPFPYQHKVKLVEGPPDGVEVVDVVYDWERRAFGFRLYHSSFEVVPHGEMCPDITATYQVVEDADTPFIIREDGK